MTRTMALGSRRDREGFTLLEIVVASALLALCLVPVLQHSRSTLQETGHSQENILARQHLMDLVERFRGSSLEELERLPDAEPSVPLGEEPESIKNDAILSDKSRVLEELEQLAASTGYVDGGIKGFQRLIDTSRLMNLTGVVWFRKDAIGAGKHELVCKVRWKSSQAPRAGQEKSISINKILFR